MKFCKYVTTESGFGWKVSKARENLMEAYAGKFIPTLNELQSYMHRGIITKEEYSALRRFDDEKGTQEDLELLQRAADRLEVKMV